jgi:hypothetical protein
MAVSVRQRLANLARLSGRPFGELLQYYAMERLLYRLSQSDHADRFVLKGAVLLTAWNLPRTRPTRDIDLLAYTENSERNLVRILSDACAVAVEPDGIIFDPSTLVGEAIREDADYPGVRVRLLGYLGAARVHLQVDVGFGDPVVPEPQEVDYPTLLDLPAPRLRGYSRESVIAEKLETMVKLGIINSRMKDFYDTWVLSQSFPYDGSALASAIVATFAARHTPIVPDPPCLTSGFADDPTKRSQWDAFVRRHRLQDVAVPLADTVADLRLFLQPILVARASDAPLPARWNPPGPWSY